MYRVGTSLPERLGSIAWRCQLPHFWAAPPPIPAWTVTGDAGEEALIGDGPTARTERLARLEAVLFLAREPLSTRKLGELADLADGTEARTLIRKLGRLYDQEICAFQIVEVAGGYQLVSRPQFASYLRRLHGPTAEVRLSAPAMETLAVVAYRQPVLRTTIESIRGVQCGELLRQLMERDLVRIAGRSEELGRPFLYGTTKRFLQVFGLRHLDELPPVETELAVDGMPRISDTERQTNQGPRPCAAPTDKPRMTEEEPKVKIEIKGREIVHPFEELSQVPVAEPFVRSEFEDDSSFDEEDDDYDYAEDDEDDDEEDEEDFDYEDDDFEDSDEPFDEDEEEEEDEDDGFEDSEWEEVEDDEEEDDEDWDDDDWDDDDDSDDDQDDEEEEEEEWEDEGD